MIGTKEKHSNCFNSFYEGNIKTCCSRNGFRGYQEKLGEYVDSAKKKAETNSGGVVDVNFEKPAIYQFFR